ncbi:hypothetical protein [Nannocystis pusilla]|uniref:hypothetical protein n=1 Tax=Nannocystis pusilla TaxID=889268 RepID=UPI003BF52791
MRRYSCAIGALALVLGCGDGAAGSGGTGTGDASTAAATGGTAATSAGPGDMSETTPTTGAQGTGDTVSGTGGTGDTESETGDTGPAPVDCGGFTPGNDFNVCSATYLGGAGADAAGGVDFAPDGTLVVGGGFPGHDFGVAPTVIGDGDGAVVRLSPSGAQVLSVTRLGAAVRDLEVAPDGTIAVVGNFGVARLAADGSAALWTAAIGEAERVAVGSDGTIAALHGKDVEVFDAGGAALGSFGVSGTSIHDIALDGASQSVFATGYRQSDQGECQQYKSTFIRSYAYDGAIEWVNYDWNGEDVDDTEDCADSTGFGVAIGRDGKLYYAAKSDGGNTVHRKQPRDLTQNAPNVATDPYDTPYGLKGANAVGYYARFDPATGEHEGGQFLVSRKAGPGEEPAAAEANAAPPNKATALADGTIVVIGNSAYLLAGHDDKSIDGVPLGAYTAYEPYVLLVSPDFTQRLAWTAFTAAGPGSAHAVAVGQGHVAALFGQSAEDVAKGPLITVDALQPAPAGDAEAWLTVFPTP